MVVLKKEFILNLWPFLYLLKQRDDSLLKLAKEFVKYLLVKALFVVI